jgi:hypothetical protein
MAERYRVYQFCNGVPVAISTWGNRIMANLAAYALAGIPFLEHSEQGHSVIRSARGMWAVVPSGEDC